MRDLRLAVISAACLILFSGHLLAQENEDTPSDTDVDLYAKPWKTWSLEVGGGLSNPYTDIRYKDFFGTLDPKNENQYGVQLRVTKMFDNAFGLQAQFRYTKLQGVFDTNITSKEDRDYLVNAGVDRGVFFKNNVIQSSLNLYWDISNTIFNINRYVKAKKNNRSIKDRRFSLYTYTGIGVSIFDAHVMNLETGGPVQSALVSDDETMELVFPLAVGTKFKLSKTIDLGFEYVHNFVLTDKLDGFAFNHPGRMKNDGYSNLDMVLSFKLGSKKKGDEHVEWVNPVQPIYADLMDLDEKVDGLSSDADGDGVSDYFDQEDDTPEGVKVTGDGVAVDADGDGIPDYQDADLFTDKDAVVDENGLALDSDGDGVPDHKDMEDTPAGSFVNFEGKTIGDYINVNAGGTYLPVIYFQTAKSTIDREFEDELFQIVKTIRRSDADVSFLVEGFADERGQNEYNHKLALERANAVKTYLVENYNIDANRLEVVSKGEEQKDSPKLFINRRVDVSIKE